MTINRAGGSQLNKGPYYQGTCPFFIVTDPAGALIGCSGGCATFASRRRVYLTGARAGPTRIFSPGRQKVHRNIYTERCYLAGFNYVLLYATSVQKQV
ncbi:hypothetical protein CBW46_007460 [Paenibacillus xerothermodurans]|uniref:Uncharacterized protein n=1 Tax=Paenibacillus xerothermodurans TaxID=1977292 RepID=A0A2W1P0D1_PAEXE|nr:hypothetical protein CBW46_007460 [Paenibacillus xerothermodurans]